MVVAAIRVKVAVPLVLLAYRKSEDQLFVLKLFACNILSHLVHRPAYESKQQVL
jgi:hypothetical protein